MQTKLKMERAAHPFHITIAHNFPAAHCLILCIWALGQQQPLSGSTAEDDDTVAAASIPGFEDEAAASSSSSLPVVVSAGVAHAFVQTDAELYYFRDISYQDHQQQQQQHLLFPPSPPSTMAAEGSAGRRTAAAAGYSLFCIGAIAIRNTIIAIVRAS